MAFSVLIVLSFRRGFRRGYTPSFRKGPGVGYICCFLRFSFSFTSLIPCLLPPREHRRNSDSTPCQQKVLFVNICHLHWLSSARGYPREFPSVPFRSLRYIWYCRPIWLVLAVPPARILATASCLFIVPNNSGLLRFPLRSLLVTLVHPVLPSLLAVLLCGVPETLVAFWGTLCGSTREILLAFTPYTLHLTPQLCCLPRL